MHLFIIFYAYLGGVTLRTFIVNTPKLGFLFIYGILKIKENTKGSFLYKFKNLNIKIILQTYNFFC